MSDRRLGRAWSSLSRTFAMLVIHAACMVVALLVTCGITIDDTQTLRGVRIWAKPMKFMVATALFALTTVWIVILVDRDIDQKPAFDAIAGLLIVTSLFEVAYIAYRATQGEANHHNIDNPVRAMLYGVMAIAAVGLTATQAWLAWIIWHSRPSGPLPVVTLSVPIALVFTFVLSTISGFMLGASQPPAGAGMATTGWHG